MRFIGFLTEKKDEGNFKKYLKSELEQLGINVMVVEINEKNVQNLKNIRFESIILNRNIAEDFLGDLKELLKTTRYLIVNGDVVKLEKIQNMNLRIVTYGFGSKCTVTTSSVDEGNMLFCLQRSMYNVNYEKIEPQEIKCSVTEKKGSQSLNMALATIDLLYRA